ncbi:MAG: hypothetical protein ACOYYS_25780 [Chloroflexota bacterium]
MTTQTQIRQAFVQDLPQLAESRLDAWLIKGDFDRFKMINDLYGSLITDYLLDWSIEAIEATLALYERHLGAGKILWNVLGDDVTIYIAPCALVEDDVLWLLHSIRYAVRQSFQRRYRVAALPLPPDFCTNVPPASLAALKRALERQDIVIDFSPRYKGCLILLPAGADAALPANVLASIQKYLGWLDGEALSLQWDWLYHPEGAAQAVFNEGFVYPPSISFVACSARKGLGAALCLRQNLREQEAYRYFEKLSAVCQGALKACKLQRCGALIAPEPACDAPQVESEPATDTSGACGQLRWASERCLRETLYFKTLNRATLFRINPVYSFASGAHRACFSLEKYRGNQHGVGLKGVNELCGQNAANGVIRRLIVCFAEALVAASEARQAPVSQLQTALFVDRFTVFDAGTAFALPDVVSLCRQLMAKFNRASEEIKIAHLRVSIAESPQPITGYTLFHHLALTQLSRRASPLAYGDRHIEVRRFCEAIAEDGRYVLERNAFDAGYQLAAASQHKNGGASRSAFRPVQQRLGVPVEFFET